MKKIVIKLDIQDSKAKQKALKAACTVSGIDSISVDMKEKKITIIGDVDPFKLASKLRKNWDSTEIFSVGPAKEPEKKEEPKKAEEPQKAEEPKKAEEPNKVVDETKKVVDEPKKAEVEEEVKKEEERKKVEEPKKPAGGEEIRKDPNEELVKSYRAHYPNYTTQYYVQSVEENPNSCVIF